MSVNQFSVENIPFGIANSTAHPTASVVTRLGDEVIFLDKLPQNDKFSKELLDSLSQPTLNVLARLPKAEYTYLRSTLQKTLVASGLSLFHHEHISTVKMLLPMDIRGFTDFSCSKEHCLNAGEAIMKKRQLPPGFLHFPIGYTGRASSIVVSGTPIVRPKGQFRKDGEVVYQPSLEMDYELEVAAVIGRPSRLGESISINDADEHIFGLVLINDWSARDIQGLEMSPLGPMNGKSFGTTMSPWVIMLDALKSCETTGPARDIAVASYLQDKKSRSTYDIKLQAELITKDSATVICNSELKWMYWTFRDLVAHQTVNGCNINTGDVLATGTISGTTSDSHGCLLELTHGGTSKFALENGEFRSYLQDGDSIRLTAQAADGVGFGECFGSIVPAT